MALAATSSLIDRLITALPAGTVVSDPLEMSEYRRDRANDPGAGSPFAVVRPTSTEDVQAVVRFAAEHDMPLVPRGAGSGLSGGSSALDGCIVVSLDRMRRIVVNPTERMAVVEPGAFNREVKAAAAAEGLWYPPDPASYEFCSIGGNVATNAGGLCCVKYGVTADYVLGMTVVLADGRAVVLGGPRLKDTAGLSLCQLFVGSEGTLGIITEVVLRLIPAQPQAATLVVTFASSDDATCAVLEISRLTRPSMLEFMDSVVIGAVEDMVQIGLDRDAAAMLVIQSDESASNAAEEIGRIADICAGNGALAWSAPQNPAEADAFVAARRLAIPAVEQRGTILLEDVGVPLPRLGALISGIESIAARHGVVIAVIAHAGDGNTHPMVVFDPLDTEQHTHAQLAYGEVMDLAIELGGTITGEHGVGRLKKPWLLDYLGPDVLELNTRIKRALDPGNIMNPGAILDL